MMRVWVLLHLANAEWRRLIMWHLVAFLVFFLVTFVLLWRRDAFYTAIYGFLFIYTIFTQFGYSQRPEYSQSIGAYFGTDVFLVYYWFVVCCFLVFFALSFLFSRKISSCAYYHVAHGRPPLGGWLFVGGTLLHWGCVGLFAIRYADVLTYDNVANDEYMASQWWGVRAYIVALKWMSPSLLLNYYMLRTRQGRRVGWCLFSFGILVFCYATGHIGNRTDLLALFIGITGFELYAAREGSGVSLKKVGALILAGGAFLAVVVGVTRLRAPDEVGGKTLEENLVVSDYYAPSHMLLAAIAFDYVDPLEVFRSNLNNTIVRRDYPYLQAPVTDLFRPGLTTRSASYAFYVFTEGYLVCGFLGFLYSGVVVFLGTSLWRGLSRSDSSVFNAFMFMLTVSFSANLVRGQSSYFVKYVYTFIAPSVFLVYLALGLFPCIRLRGAARPLERCQPHTQR